jgi:hypothetical protein
MNKVEYSTKKDPLLLFSNLWQKKINLLRIFFDSLKDKKNYTITIKRGKL